jgi:hypothetical protein
MRTPANKAQLPAACPQCGRQSTAHGCRPVPLGWWCLASGLTQSPESYIHPTVEEDRAASDPATAKARSEEAAAQRAFDEADEQWVDSVAAARACELKARSGPALYAADMSPIMPDRDTGEERRLRDREAEARVDRERAASALVRARTEARLAEAAARRQGGRS